MWEHFGSSGGILEFQEQSLPKILASLHIEMHTIFIIEETSCLSMIKCFWSEFLH